VGAQKRVLIVTDGTEPIAKAAKSIAGDITGCSVNILSSESFQGTDLLSADIFFIGCEAPKPASFSYISQLLAHINLAGRRCGVFSTNKDALQYLCGIVENCEAKLGNPVLIGEDSADAVKNSVKEIISGS
jgi:hypothetical protein